MLATGYYSCMKRGGHSPSVDVKKMLQEALQRFDVLQLFRFDPEQARVTGSIPKDIPQGVIARYHKFN